MSAKERAAHPGVAVLSIDSYEQAAINWLWPRWLARGKLSLLAGKPGCGKTTIALDLAAAVSSGGKFPDGTTAPQGDVLLWSGEDDVSDTLLPRLDAAGANFQRVKWIKGDDAHTPFDPATDVPMLSDRIAQMVEQEGLRPSLIIIDPIISAITGDSHKNAEVRRDLAELVQFASLHNCALLGLTHFTKGTAGADPIERVTGSLAFGALARTILVAADHNEGEGRVLALAKSNIGKDGDGFLYAVEEGISSAGIATGRINWMGPVEGTATELVADEPKQRPRQSCEETIRKMIDEAGGEIESKLAWAILKETGYANRTVKRACENVVKAFQQDRKWYWRHRTVRDAS